MKREVRDTDRSIREPTREDTGWGPWFHEESRTPGRVWLIGPVAPGVARRSRNVCEGSGVAVDRVKPICSLNRGYTNSIGAVSIWRSSALGKENMNSPLSDIPLKNVAARSFSAGSLRSLESPSERAMQQIYLSMTSLLHRE